MLEQASDQSSPTGSALRQCLGWVVELGISPEMTFYQKKNLALINTTAFISLLMALPAIFVLILMGFSHPFSLLVGSVMAACLVLILNGVKRVEWARALFAFAPAIMITAYSLVETSGNGLGQPLNYILARQGLCLALLVPMLIYGFEARHKMLGVAGVCLIIFLSYDVGSMRLGAYYGEEISGVSHGLFTLLSLLQFTALAGCILYIQNYNRQHAIQAQQANEKLKRLAIRDGLTGLFNHQFMQEMIGDAINRARRSRNPLSLLIIDVDNFKQINDTFGHNAGDEVLVSLTRLLKANIRSTDYLGRWGGDELVIVLTDTDIAGANNLAEKLRSLVENQVFLSSKSLTISLGGSEGKQGDSPASMIARADAALYRAKRAGRNRVECKKLAG